jgi:hypothetical protein
MKSAAKKLSITLPSDVERALAKRAKEEHRTMSGILQESAKLYLRSKSLEGETIHSQKRRPIDDPKVRRAYELIKNAQLEFGDGMTAEEAIREMRDSR